MREWLENLSSSERKAVLAGAAVLAVLLLYLVLWRPLDQRNRTLALELEQSQKDLTWMSAAALEVKALENSATRQQVKDDRTLIARVTAELKDGGLEASQVRPEGEERLRLNLEAVPFSRLLQTLERLQNGFGIQVREALVEPSNTTGLVDCRLLLERAGGA